MTALTRTERRPIEPGTRLWEETGLVTFSLTTGSAFALQVMHPAVGAVVGEHSVFRTDAIGRARRSVASVMTWIYGGEAALEEADRLRALHVPLRSTDAEGVTHTALASGPWAWILLTAPYAYLTAARYFSRRPMEHDEAAAFYGEVQQLMLNLHVAPKEIPPSYEDYLALFDDVIEHTLVAHPTAYEFLEASRRVPPPPALPAALRPLWRVLADVPGRLQYFVTVGTLPPRAREILGLPWSDRDERRLRLFGRLVAWLVPLLPERLRYLPIAYEARRVERAKAALARALARRPT
ncbi:oxygenase MpaB family protein [Actinophytocola xanthii]|uniref:oxygenase MpaB family protein n=1 Tax=Actinophytocola xanthii TaxID=1912961 RepID=UPI000A9BA5FF|nr:oxygenase MpaB family protein [Actinophytocola xanthii]